MDRHWKLVTPAAAGRYISTIHPERDRRADMSLAKAKKDLSPLDFTKRCSTLE